MTRQISRIEVAHSGAGNRMLSLSLEPVPRANGAPLSLVILVQDVDVDVDVGAQAQRYQLLFQHSLDGILFGVEHGPATV